MPEFRIPGLSSGMDMNENVQKLMKAERARTSTWEQKKTMLQWEQAQYNTVISKYTSFIIDARDDFGMTTDFVGHVNSKSGDFLTKTAVSSNSNVTVAASSDALVGSQTINVVQKADGVSMVSGGAVSQDTNATNLVDRFGLGGGEIISFTITDGDGVEKEFDYTDLANTSLQDVIDDVNNADMGVRMSYDSTLDRVFLQTTDTGSNAVLNVKSGTSTNPADGGVNNLDLLTSQSNQDGLLKLDINPGDAYSGVDARVNYISAGAAVSVMTFESNTFTINEITFDVSNATLGEDITASVSENEMGVYDKVQQFVEKFNKMNDYVQGKLTEKRDRDKTPLSVDDKDKMTEQQIDTYEKDAQKGLLTNSSILTSIQSQLRIAMIEQVEGPSGDIGNLSSIGITMSDNNSGNLEIDEDKLRQSISNGPQKVMDILFKKPESNANIYEKNLDSAQIATRRSESGVFNRMTDIVSNGLVSLTTKAGKEHEGDIRKVNSSIIVQTLSSGGTSLIDQELARVSDKLKDLEEYLSEREDYYWKTFSRMESSMTDLNSQLMWLQSQGM